MAASVGESTVSDSDLLERHRIQEAVRGTDSYAITDDERRLTTREERRGPPKLDAARYSEAQTGIERDPRHTSTQDVSSAEPASQRRLDLVSSDPVVRASHRAPSGFFGAQDLHDQRLELEEVGSEPNDELDPAGRGDLDDVGVRAEGRVIDREHVGALR